jgi:hypothetical protein
MEFKFEAKLFVIDAKVAAEILKHEHKQSWIYEQGVVEIAKSLFEVSQQKIGHPLLKISDRKILV